MAPSKPSSSTVTSSGYTSLPGDPDFDLKSHLMSVIEAFKEDINNSLKEIQEEAIKQLRKMNKTVQDFKREVETILNSQCVFLVYRGH